MQQRGSVFTLGPWAYSLKVSLPSKHSDPEPPNVTRLPWGIHADAVTSPIESDEATLVGARECMMSIVLRAGKVDENNEIPELGTVALGRLAGVIALTGNGGVLKNRSDGRVTAPSAGAAIMPAYNWAMTDTETWSICICPYFRPITKYSPILKVSLKV